MTKTDVRPSGALRPGEERRTPIGAFLARWADPWIGYIYWRFGLVDSRTGKPDLKKIMAFAAFILCAIFNTWLWLHVLDHGEDGKDPHYPLELNWACGMTIFLVFASHGLAGLKVWAETKGGGTMSVVQTAVQADAEIAARRLQGGGTMEATP